MVKTYIQVNLNIGILIATKNHYAIYRSTIRTNSLRIKLIEIRNGYKVRYHYHIDKNNSSSKKVQISF